MNNPTHSSISMNFPQNYKYAWNDGFQSFNIDGVSARYDSARKELTVTKTDGAHITFTKVPSNYTVTPHKTLKI